ncbi:MAG: hypothetical protein AABX29_00420 [Nanoarchaeota archaeon]
MSIPEIQARHLNEINPKRPKERIVKVGLMASGILSGVIALLGLDQVIKSSEAYDEFYRQHPQLSWAEGIVSDTQTEIDRVFRENDRQGFEDIQKRTQIVSSAYVHIEKFEDKKPPEPSKEQKDGRQKIGIGITGLILTHGFSRRKYHRRKTTQFELAVLDNEAR